MRFLTLPFLRSALPVVDLRYIQTAAAVFSLLNDYLLSKGRPPLGFANPWLYEIGWLGFTDIISGTNPGCGTDGFSADEGWDPVRPARLLCLDYC